MESLDFTYTGVDHSRSGSKKKTKPTSFIGDPSLDIMMLQTVYIFEALFFVVQRLQFLNIVNGFKQSFLHTVIPFDRNANFFYNVISLLEFFDEIFAR